MNAQEIRACLNQTDWFQTQSYSAQAFAVIRGQSFLAVFQPGGESGHRRASEFASEFGGLVVPVMRR